MFHCGDIYFRVLLAIMILYLGDLGFPVNLMFSGTFTLLCNSIATVITYHVIYTVLLSSPCMTFDLLTVIYSKFILLLLSFLARVYFIISQWVFNIYWSPWPSYDLCVSNLNS